MVHAYWFIGREIIEHEQGGAQRADYGKQVIQRLARRLSAAYGKGFGRSNLWRMRQFYLCFPNGSALSTDRDAKLAALRRELDTDESDAVRQPLLVHPCHSRRSPGLPFGFLRCMNSSGDFIQS